MTGASEKRYGIIYVTNSQKNEMLPLMTKKRAQQSILVNAEISPSMSWA